MLSLIKYEFKGRSRYILGFLALFILEHFYIVGYKLNKTNPEQLVQNLMFNAFLSTTVLLSITFIFGLINYSKHLKAKPGYMFFMANTNRSNLLFSKIALTAIETAILGLVAAFITFIEINLLNLNSFFKVLLSSEDLNLVFTQSIRLVLYIVIAFLLALVTIMLAMTIRAFLLKEKRFSGFLTTALTLGFFFLRDKLYQTLNIDFIASFRFDIGSEVHKVQNVSTETFVADIILLIIMLIISKYILDKKLSI